ncbi:MAG: DUF87 domain-containing protein [Hyphomicrobiales bacterium]|nr:DUF87 domain-containing protein [Hyphomicrobiales bacterium]
MTTSEAAEKPLEPPLPPIGEILFISGSRARVLMFKPPDGEQPAGHSRPYVGTLLTVDTGAAIVLCLITSMTAANPETDPGIAGRQLIEMELVGELPCEPDGYLCTYRRGVSVYPRLGDTVHPPTRQILEKAYYFGSFDAVEIGNIHQDPSIPAVIKVNEMLGKHFAILGATGTGKSCAVALILRQFLAKQPKSHIVLVDPHNEYKACFGEQANIVNLDNLCLPFWFLNFDEIVEILLGSKDGHAGEIELLREFIPAAKRQYTANRGRESRLLQRSITRKERYSVDVPVPYRISDLIEQIRTEMGRLETQKDLQPFKHLIGRIEALVQDPRYSFMFGHRVVDDNLSEVLKQIFRIPVEGKPITVVQLVGLPPEIVNVVVSILSRLAFDLALWSDGKMPITFVCEEAHRYVPREKDVGFEPTKRIISRIAKEGRKYGISLCVVSQRPGDLDPTILSQCSTIFTMRLSNERDQQIVRSAISDAAESLLRFLPSLSTRETIAFGEGVTLPSRVMLAELPKEAMPKGAGAHLDASQTTEELDPSFVDEAIMRWRSVGSDVESLLPPEHEAATADAGAAPPHAPGPAPAQPAPPAPPRASPALDHETHNPAAARPTPTAPAGLARMPEHQPAPAQPGHAAATPRPAAPAPVQPAAPPPAPARQPAPVLDTGMLNQAARKPAPQPPAEPRLPPGFAQPRRA